MANKNLAYSLVATAPSPATSGTSLVVTAGTGARFAPTGVVGSYYVTACPPNVAATPDNAEILLVTTISTDTFTITRAQRGFTAKSIAVGWQIFEGIYVEEINANMNLALAYAIAL